MKYLLRTKHIIEGAERDPGTVVGDEDDVGVKFYGDPTPDMVGLDDASAAKVNEVHNRLYGTNAAWHPDKNHPDPRVRAAGVEEPPHEFDREAAKMSLEERKKKEDESAKAMAEANAKYQERIAARPMIAVHAAAVRGGTMVGPATPNVDMTDPRPTQPLKDELPAQGEIRSAPAPRPAPKKD